MLNAGFDSAVNVTVPFLQTVSFETVSLAFDFPESAIEEGVMAVSLTETGTPLSQPTIVVKGGEVKFTLDNPQLLILNPTFPALT